MIASWNRHPKGLLALGLCALAALPILSGCGKQIDKDASPYPYITSLSHVPFSVIYDLTVEGEGHRQEQVCYDGVGRERMDMQVPVFGNGAHIIDFNSQTHDVLIDSQKSFSHFNSLKEIHIPLLDDTQAETFKAKSLGSKKIGSDDCNGWSFTNRYGNPEEVWISKEHHMPVSYEYVDIEGHKRTEQLLSYEGNKPSPTLFRVPPDYKPIDK
jgi:hypothetical protein